MVGWSNLMWQKGCILNYFMWTWEHNDKDSHRRLQIFEKRLTKNPNHIFYINYFTVFYVKFSYVPSIFGKWGISHKMWGLYGSTIITIVMMIVTNHSITTVNFLGHFDFNSNIMSFEIWRRRCALIIIKILKWVKRALCLFIYFDDCACHENLVRDGLGKGGLIVFFMFN